MPDRNPDDKEPKVWRFDAADEAETLAGCGRCDVCTTLEAAPAAGDATDGRFGDLFQEFGPCVDHVSVLQERFSSLAVGGHGCEV